MADLPSDHPRRQILALLSTRSKVWRTGEIAAAMRMEASQVRYQLKELVSAGLLSATGETSHRTYSPA